MAAYNSRSLFRRILIRSKLPSVFYLIKNTVRKILIGQVIINIHMRIVRRQVVHLYGPTSITTAPDELVVVCLVRNGEPWIRSFLDHYFKLGAVHVCFLDNGSTDATIQIAQSYDRVTILQSDLPYGRYKYYYKSYLAEKFCGNDWVLIADIDELFNYPMSTQIGLSRFLSYLNHYEYTAVVTQMLDMYADRPLKRSSSVTGGPLMKMYDCYDLDELNYGGQKKITNNGSNTISNNEITTISGGVRKRLFGAQPNLTKFSLFKLCNTTVKTSMISAHRISGAKIADISSVLLHYKLIDGFYDYTDWAVSSKCYYEDSKEYRAYHNLLQVTPELIIAGPATRALKNIDQLVDEKFLVLSDTYKTWVAEKQHRGQGEPPPV